MLTTPTQSLALLAILHARTAKIIVHALLAKVDSCFKDLLVSLTAATD